MKSIKSEIIYDELLKMYPDAECELVHHNIYELAISVILSAQTTDVSVNKITPKLFRQYPDIFSLAKANLVDVQKHLKTLGLYRSKAANIIAFSQQVVERFDGSIPNNRLDLMSLPGVGQKTANVILSVGYNEPAIAVDTHVFRVAKRLRLAYQNDDVLVVEKKLEKKFLKSQWSKLHHLLIFFGRYRCKAKNPQCKDCPFIDFCYYQKHNAN